LKQEDTERVRDFKIRIDDYYKIAYGENAATSLNVTVIALRNETKNWNLIVEIKIWGCGRVRIKKNGWVGFIRWNGKN
jgi:hypothetical protein